MNIEKELRKIWTNALEKKELVESAYARGRADERRRIGEEIEKLKCEKCSGEGAIDGPCEECGTCPTDCDECNGTGFVLNRNLFDDILSLINKK